MNPNILLNEKYRPISFKELVSQDVIINIISNMIKSNRFPHLLLYGESGTGKTTTAHICARQLYGDKYDQFILELNGSDDRGITVVRNKIKKFAEGSQFFTDKIKIIILDEADFMTSDAQFALRRIIEKYTYNVRFIIICNYIDKIIPAIRARCMQFKFKLLNKKCIIDKLIKVCQQESINYEESGIEKIVTVCNRDMRKCYNLLQSLASEKITCELINNHLGIINDSLIDNIFKQTDIINCINYLQNLLEQGYDLSEILLKILDKLILYNNPLQAIINLAKIEERLEKSNSEYLQICALASIVQQVKNL